MNKIWNIKFTLWTEKKVFVPHRRNAVAPQERNWWSWHGEPYHEVGLQFTRGLFINNAAWLRFIFVTVEKTKCQYIGV